MMIRIGLSQLSSMPQLFEYSGKTRQQTPQAGNIHSGSHWNLYVERDCETWLWSHIPLNPKIGSYFCSALVFFWRSAAQSKNPDQTSIQVGWNRCLFFLPCFPMFCKVWKKKSLTPPGANDKRIITSMLVKKTAPTSAHVSDDFLQNDGNFPIHLIFIIWASGHGRSWTFHREPTVPWSRSTSQGDVKVAKWCWKDIHRLCPYI